MFLRTAMLVATALWLTAGFAPIFFAPSIIAGDVTGTVTDATGPVVPRAAVALTNTTTNLSQNHCCPKQDRKLQDLLKARGLRAQ